MLKRPGKMFIAVAVFWLLLDFVTKQSVTLLMELGESIPVWEGVFHITYLRNSGAAFSMMQGQFWLFYLAMALLALMIAWFWWSEKPRHWIPVLSTAVVLAGAIGNTFDRVTAGAVIDMFDARIINFAIFNVADIGITVGSVLFVTWFLFMSGQISWKKHPAGEQGQMAEDPEEEATVPVEGPEDAARPADDPGYDVSTDEVSEDDLATTEDTSEEAPPLEDLGDTEVEPVPELEPLPKAEPKKSLKKRLRGTFERLEGDIDRDEF